MVRTRNNLIYVREENVSLIVRDSDVDSSLSNPGNEVATVLYMLCHDVFLLVLENSTA
jgi:hypothetical protein